MQNVDLTKKKWNIVKHKRLLSRIKMGKEILTFADIEIKKDIFYFYKSPVLLREVGIERVLVSNKIPFGKKKKTINTLLVACIIIIK